MFYLQTKPGLSMGEDIEPFGWWLVTKKSYCGVPQSHFLASFVELSEDSSPEEKKEAIAKWIGDNWTRGTYLKGSSTIEYRESFPDVKIRLSKESGQPAQLELVQ